MADSLNKTELVAAVAAESGQSQAAVSSVVDAFFHVIADAVGKGTKVASRAGSRSSAPTVPPARAATPRPARRSRSPRATA